MSRGKYVGYKPHWYAITLCKYFGFVDSVPPFYLHVNYRNMRLCAVELKASVLSLALKDLKNVFRCFTLFSEEKFHFCT